MSATVKVRAMIMNTFVKSLQSIFKFTNLFLLIQVLMYRSQKILIVHGIALKVTLFSTHNCTSQLCHARVEMFTREGHLICGLLAVRHELVIEHIANMWFGDGETLLHYLCRKSPLL